MSDELLHDPIKELNEIRNQLSYTKRLGFFLGAGASKAIGISDIAELTKKVEENLDEPRSDSFQKIKGCIQGGECKLQTVEDILNQLRLIRQLTFESEEKTYEGISGKDAKDLDVYICNSIYDIVLKEEEESDLSYPKKFVAWLNWLSRDFPKEIFTTNYDLVLEKALESLTVPYFDGFVGANEPFFLPESLEKDTPADNPPASWIRLWKLHGSLGWFWIPTEDGSSNRIVRLGEQAKNYGDYSEIVIYPSKEKYESSRKQPFISYFDRLKTFLNDGERLFIISGYSFSDEHINAQIFDSLRQNNRLHILAFFYSDNTINKLIKNDFIYPNLSAFGPKKAIINGLVGSWVVSKEDPFIDQFWDLDKKKILIGDFKELVNFFLACSGRTDKIEKVVNVNNEG